MYDLAIGEEGVGAGERGDGGMGGEVRRSGDVEIEVVSGMTLYPFGAPLNSSSTCLCSDTT